MATAVFNWKKTSTFFIYPLKSARRWHLSSWLPSPISRWLYFSTGWTDIQYRFFGLIGRAWDYLWLWSFCAGGRRFTPRPWHYSRRSFSSSQATSKVFSSSILNSKVQRFRFEILLTQTWPIVLIISSDKIYINIMTSISAP